MKQIQIKKNKQLTFLFQLISAYFLVFFILGLSHVTGIQELIDRDTEDALEREALEDISSRHINSQRMELARHNATGNRNWNLNSSTSADISSGRQFIQICFSRTSVPDVLGTGNYSQPILHVHSSAVWRSDGTFAHQRYSYCVQPFLQLLFVCPISE